MATKPKPFKREHLRKAPPLVILAEHPDHEMDARKTQAIVAAAREFGWDLLNIRFTMNALPRDRKPAGALVGLLPDSGLVRELRRIDCPTVRIGMYPHPEDHLVPAVLPDMERSAALAVDHFSERGFRDVGYVAHEPWANPVTPYAAFKNHASVHGMRCHLLQLKDASQCLSQQDRFEDRASQVGSWLAGLPKPIGLLGYTDKMGASLCTIAQQGGFRVPEEVAILGTTNSIRDCEMAPVPLSSIDTALEVRGRTAASLLRELMAGHPAPAKPVLVPAHGIVVRRSTDVLAVDDPVVAQAMRFMWDHLYLDISVGDVADAVNTQRRTLERAFRRHLGRGVNAELRRRRLEQSRDLLRTTELSITDISLQLGFSSRDYFTASFRRAYGVSPRQHRIRAAG